jgi:tRNA threonylcarbamoyladenosine biosynthesis protein TsaE
MSVLDPTSLPFHLTIHLANQEATQEFGQRLGMALGAGQIVALRGELGAGKTTLTQGIAVGLGITARVTSPTFTLINQYEPGARRLLLIHMDTYRLGDGSASALAEAANLGLEEILADASLPDSHSDGAVVVIEWAERVASLLPAHTLYIHLTSVPADADARTATLATSNAEVAAILRLFAPDH